MKQNNGYKQQKIQYEEEEEFLKYHSLVIADDSVLLTMNNRTSSDELDHLEVMERSDTMILNRFLLSQCLKLWMF